MNDLLMIVRDHIRERCYAAYGDDTCILPVVEYAGDYESLELAGVLLWDSEGNGAGELEVNSCLKVFAEHVAELGKLVKAVTT